MSTPLHILVIEDSLADFTLLTHQLRRQGLLTECRRVADLPELRAALATDTAWDLLISDYSVPGLDFEEALATVQQTAPNLPVILVSGSIGEERAVALLRQGVWDFLLKDNLARLGSVIERSLRDRIDRRARHDAEAALHESRAVALRMMEDAIAARKRAELMNAELQREARERQKAEEALRIREYQLQQVLDTNPNIIFVKDRDGRIIMGNRALAGFYGTAVEALLGKTQAELQQAHGVAAAECAEWLADDRAVIDSGKPRTLTEHSTLADGSVHWYHTHKLPLDLPDGRPGVLVVSEDVTEQKRADEALAASNQRYRSLFEGMLDGYAHCRMIFADGRAVDYEYLAVNACFEVATGLKAEQVVGRRVSEVLPGYCQDNPESLATFGKVAQTGEPVRWEHYLKALDRWFAFSVYRPAADEIVIVSRNITEQKRAEAALRASEEQFRTMFEMASIGMAQSDPLSARFRQVNRKFCEITGYSAEELRQLAPADLTHPEDRALDSELFQRVVNGQAGSYRLEKRYVRKDGRTAWVNVNMTVLRDPAGRPTLTMAAIEDITERKQAETARTASEMRYRRLLAAMSDGVFVSQTGTEGQPMRFVEANEAACSSLGYTREELLQMGPFDIDPAITPEQMLALTAELRERGEVVFQTEHRGKLGRTIPVEISLRPFELGGQQLMMAVVRDLSERKQAEAQREALENQLHQAQKLESIGTLAGGVAHDFNNLLSIINGYTELALRGLPEGDPLRRRLEPVLGAGERAAGLTRQLLAFSRKQVITPTVLDLNEVIANVQKMLARLIPEDIALETRLSPALRRVKADAGQIEQVLMNLVVNARDAMPQGGTIVVETQNRNLDADYARNHPLVTPGRYVLLAVSDTGCGMSKEVQARVFEPFFTTKEKGKGTGLGLSTVYGIVRQAGGYVHVYSEVGKGTTFRIYLPEDLGSSKLQETVHAPAVGGSETILLVEDEASVRSLTEDILRGAGYKVLAAPNGVAALQLVAAQPDPIDLLLTDVVMPELNGPQLAIRLGAQAATLKVLYMSGYTDDAIGHHGIIDTGVHLLNKPFGHDELLRRVREALDSPPDS